jgi:hypothetical protein
MGDSKHDQKVRERAYHIWEAEGRPHGRHDQHWQDALRDVAASATDVIASVKTKVRRTAGKIVAAVSGSTESTPPPPVPKVRKQKRPAAALRKPGVSKSTVAAGTSSPLPEKPAASKKAVAAKTRRASPAKAGPTIKSS